MTLNIPHLKDKVTLTLRNDCSSGPRARLFKTNDVVSYCFVKISNIIISNMPIFFVEKNERSFCSAKASPNFSTKNFSIYGYKVIKS